MLELVFYLWYELLCCVLFVCFILFFKHKTAYEMRISDRSSDVCSSDLLFIHMRAIRVKTISENNRANRSIIDHMNIIHALERRDTELAERLVRQHEIGRASCRERVCK